LDLEERFMRYLVRYRITLVYGWRSRCFKSISAMERREDGTRLLSINADFYGAQAVEATAYQIAMLKNGEGNRRVRIGGMMGLKMDQQRAWWTASEITIPNEALAIGARRRWDDQDFLDAYCVTPRLLQARKQVWQAKLGMVFASAPVTYDLSTRVADPCFWCDVL
jgi:hypothetical protein